MNNSMLRGYDGQDGNPQRVLATLLAGAFMAMGAVGCSIRSDPFTDAFADDRRVTTPSVEEARAAEVTPVATNRPYGRHEIGAADGTVAHSPLFFEDPFEEHGSDDSRFAWTSEERFVFFAGPARFLINVVAFPISAAATPFWQVMQSDGVASRSVVCRLHDADR